MAQLRAPRNRPLSADFASIPTAKQPSMLYSILPSAVKSRLPRIPSLRRSVSMYGVATRRKSGDSRYSSGSRTPEADYKNAMVLSARSGAVMGKEEMAGYMIESLSVSSDEDLPGTNKRRGQGMELTESKSGIRWKFANQGLNLLSLVVEESSTISQDTRFGNASFARQLYLHALTYLLRALPQDLTTEEQFSVRSALPPGVVEPLRLNSDYTTGSHTSAQDSQPSLLHRTLASTIIQLFIFFQFIMPYLRYLARAAYQYDREHKITEKVVAQSIETVDLVGKRGLTVGSAVWGMGDGKVGQYIGETAKWFVDGVTGGIHEGVGEGMVIMGVGRPQGLRVESR